MSISNILKKNLTQLLYPSLETMTIAVPVYFGIFLSYLELSPKLGNIWYRVAEDGKKHINLGSLKEFFTKPFTNSFFWWPKYWDINIYIGLYLTIVIINFVYKDLSNSKEK